RTVRVHTAPCEKAKAHKQLVCENGALYLALKILSSRIIPLLHSANFSHDSAAEITRRKQGPLQSRLLHEFKLHQRVFGPGLSTNRDRLRVRSKSQSHGGRDQGEGDHREQQRRS